MTAIISTYVAPSATNLTQSINRTGSSSLTSAFTPIDLTTGNYSKSYTATFALTTTASAATTLTAITNGLSFVRVANTYTLSSVSVVNGVSINNWAYFKKALRTLSIVSDSGTFPNPACSIAVSISDGTTNLTGTTTVNALTATVPTTPGTPTLTRHWDTGIELNWAASTQSFGPGVAGYYVYRNGTGSVYDTVLAATTYLDTAVIATDVYTYQVQAFDSSGVPLVSAISGVSDSLPVATIPTTPTGLTATRNWGTNVSLSWTGSTQAVGSGVTGYYIYKDGSGTPLVDVTSGTSYLDTSTTTDSSGHSYTVKAHDGAVIKTLSLASTAATTPAATTPTTPGSFALTGRGTTTNSLNWTVSTQATGPGVAGYYVYRDGNIVTPYATVSGAASTTFNDTVDGTTNHTYQLAAFDASSPVVKSTLTSTLDAVFYLVTAAASNTTSETIYKSSDATNWSSIGTISVGNANAYSRLTKDGKVLFYPASSSDKVVVMNVNTGAVLIETMTGADAAGRTSVMSMEVFRENSIYVAGLRTPFGSGVTYSTYSTSSDGITWTSRNFPIASTKWSDRSSANGLFYIKEATGVPTATYYSSSDGINWTSRTAPITTNTIGISGNGSTVWTFYDGSGVIYRSTTGIDSWNLMTLPDIPISRPTYENNKWFTVALTNNRVIYSSDATTWNNATVGWTIPTNGFVNPTFINSEYVIFNAGQIAKSSDGIIWTVSTLTGNPPGAGALANILYWTGKYRCIDATYIYESTDAIAWTRTAHGLSDISIYLTNY